MTNIWIRERNGRFRVTMDEYPGISFTAKTYLKARNRAISFVKSEMSKDNVVKEEKESERSGKVTMGFAA